MYSTAGMASFQLSFVKMAVVNVWDSVASVVFDGSDLDISYIAFYSLAHTQMLDISYSHHTIVKLIVSFMTSFKNTLVLVWYLCPPARGIILE